MNERIKALGIQAGGIWIEHATAFLSGTLNLERFAELIVRECASEYNKLINGEAVVLPKDREHAEALVRVGMFYLENNK